HPGTGRSTGIIDLPVAREASTDYPVMVGSSLKGALRDKARGTGGVNVDEAFGKPDSAGALLVSDGRLRLLPARCLTGTYRWITCPDLVGRYRRDLMRAGLHPLPPVPEVEQLRALASDEGPLFLEEREFQVM